MTFTHNTEWLVNMQNCKALLNQLSKNDTREFAHQSPIFCMMDESHLHSITASRLLRAGDIETNPGPNTNSTIDSTELHKLVTTATYFDVPMFTRIGLALGFTPEELHSYVVKHGANGVFAYMPLQEIFDIWSQTLPHDTNVRAAFAEKLWEANMHDFANRVLGNFSAPSSGPSPSDSPLTEKQILQCSFDLQDHYRITRNAAKLGKFSVIPTDDLLEVNLNKHRQYLERSPMTYDDLVEMKLSHRILVEGGAGVGKTMLCSKIAWDWCQGKVLTQLDMVILIPLDKLDVNQSIGEVTKTYLSKSNTSTAAQIERFIHEHPDKVMIILDGLDEYKGSISAVKHMTNIASVLRSNKFTSCRVIATTRPGKAAEIFPKEILVDNMRLVYILEYGVDTQTTFIKSFFRTRGEESLAEELMTALKKNDVMAEITAPLPFYSAVLCILWDLVSSKECQDILKLQTHSQLLKELIRYLKEDYISRMFEGLTEEKARELSQDVDERILRVGEMAFEGLLGNTPTFPEHKLTQWQDAVDTCCEIGLLTEVEEVISSINKHTKDSKPSTSSFTFTHRIFQEYLSSMYLASLYDSNREKYKELVMRALLRHEEFHLLLMFTASFGRDIGMDIAQKLVDQHASLDVCASVAFECRVEEAGRVVGSNVTTVELSRETPAHSVVSQLFLLKWCPLESLSVTDISCGRTTSRFLGDTVYSSPTLGTASIRCTHLDADFCSILRRTERAEGKIDTLEMDISPFSRSTPAAKDIATFLLQLPCLTSLKLQCYDMPDAFFARADSLAASSQVKELDLDLGRKKLKTSPISDTAAQDLARFLMQSLSITKLKMHCHLVASAFYSALTSFTTLSQIEEMDLDFDRWKMDQCPEAEAGVRDLAKSLFQMPSLRRLKLHCCIFVDVFFGTAAMYATSSQIEELDIHLEILVMKKDLVRIEWASQNLAKCLFQLPCLTSVKLRSNVLREEFFPMAVSLASSSKLENLDIDTYMVGFRRRAEFPISESSSQDLATLLMSLPCLTYLQLTTSQSHESFMSTLASFAPSSQIQHVKVDYRGLHGYPLLESDKPIRDYARFLFQMPSLTHLEIMFWDGEVSEAFWSTASELAASSQLQDLDLYVSRNTYVTPEEKAAIHVAKFLLHLPNLSRLKINFRDFPPGFLATLAAGATTSRIQDLDFNMGLLTQDNMTWCDEIAKEIPRFLFRMPLLKCLKFNCLALTDIFFETAVTEASSSQVEDLFLHICIRRWDSLPIVERAAQDFARMLFQMPCLTRLVVECDTLPDIFFAMAGLLAPSSKLQEFTLDITIWRTHSRPRFGQNAARYLFQMPHLSSLKLKCNNLPDDFYAAAASLAPSSQIQELDLDLGTLTISPGTESAMRALARLIFMMPRLTRLNLTCNNLPKVFYAAAVSMPPSPQLTDITINGRPYQHRYDQETQVLLQKLLPPEEDKPLSSDDEASTPQIEPVLSDDKASTLKLESMLSDDKPSAWEIEPVSSDEEASTPQIHPVDVETGASQDGEECHTLHDDDDEASESQVHPVEVETGESLSDGGRGALLQPLLERRRLRRATLPKCRVS